MAILDFPKVGASFFIEEIDYEYDDDESANGGRPGGTVHRGGTIEENRTKN